MLASVVLVKYAGKFGLINATDQPFHLENNNVLNSGTRLPQTKCTLVSRLRLDAALYEFAPSPVKGQRGRHREKGERFTSLKELATDMTQPWRDVGINWYGGEKKNVRMLSGIHLWYSSGEKPLPIRWVLVIDPDTNEAEAFFSTDLQLAPEQIINWFVLRWNIEVTFVEIRAHLGMETQRQWSDKAIARTTPCLMALFSLICLFAIEMLKNQSLPILSTAWYNKKAEATFSDILAFVRRNIWAENYFNDSTFDGEYMKIKPEQWESLARSAFTGGIIGQSRVLGTIFKIAFAKADDEINKHIIATSANLKCHLSANLKCHLFSLKGLT